MENVTDAMKGDAVIIAAAILRTDTDDRGDLFHCVADILSEKSQHFTAALIDRAAHAAGLNRCK